LTGTRFGLPLGRHHGGPSHADLVKCTAAKAPCQRGVRRIPSTEKSASRSRSNRSTVRARRRTGCRGRWSERPPDGARLSGEPATEQYNRPCDHNL